MPLAIYLDLDRTIKARTPRTKYIVSMMKIVLDKLNLTGVLFIPAGEDLFCFIRLNAT